MQHTVSRPRVFLADDSVLSRSRVAAMLLAQGMDIVGQADTPELAVAGVLAICPDVVVLDVQFKRGTGLQVLHAVLQVKPDLPFVVLSNHADPAYRTRYLAAGAACFLDKHAEFYELGKAVTGLAQPQRSGQAVPSQAFMEPSCH